MDAAPELGEDVRPFVAVARWLSGLGLSAPRILAEDPAHGFLLIEDLGDDLFARVMARDAKAEMPLYRAAVEVLLTLHSAAPMAGLAAYDAATMVPLAALAYDWYLGESRVRTRRARPSSAPRSPRCWRALRLFGHDPARLPCREPAVAAGTGGRGAGSGCWTFRRDDRRSGL